MRTINPHTPSDPSCVWADPAPLTAPLPVLTVIWLRFYIIYFILLNVNENHLHTTHNTHPWRHTISMPLSIPQNSTLYHRVPTTHHTTHPPLDSSFLAAFLSLLHFHGFSHHHSYCRCSCYPALHCTALHCTAVITSNEILYHTLISFLHSSYMESTV